MIDLQYTYDLKTGEHSLKLAYIPDRTPYIYRMKDEDKDISAYTYTGMCADMFLREIQQEIEQKLLEFKRNHDND